MKPGPASGRIPLMQRVWARIDVRGPDECWPWTAGRTSTGYALIRDRDASTRSVARLLMGDPPGLHILHSCDNPPCCNPRHLRAGTHFDNMQDRRSRGRYVFQRKLTPEQREAIVGDPRTHALIAADYGITRGYVSMLKRALRPRTRS